MSQPQLTVITIAFENPGELELTLHSVAAQGVDERVQHVVIDGSPSAVCQDVVAKYGHITDVVHEQDNGIYDAMNKGLDRVSGRYVWFLNSGDLYPGYRALDALLERLSQTPDDTVLYSDVYMDVDSHRYMKMVPEPEALQCDPTRRTPSHQAIIYPSSFFATRRYSLNYLISGDSALTLKALRKYPLSKLEEPLAVFSLGGVSNVRPDYRTVVRHCVEWTRARALPCWKLLLKVPKDLLKHTLMKGIGWGRYYRIMFFLRRRTYKKLRGRM